MSHLFLFHNKDKKHFVISAPRTASTHCRAIFTTSNGWENLTDDPKCKDLAFLKDQYDQGAEFYVLSKEPTKRLLSAFELVIPMLSDGTEDYHNNISSFSGAVSYHITRYGSWELMRYGYMNYCLSDNHMSWGNSIYALFLESVGIKTKLLYLDTDVYSVTDHLVNFIWGFGQETLDDYFSKHYSNEMHNLEKRTNNKDFLETQIIRDQRLGIYLGLFGAAPGCFFYETFHDKFYSVFDWMNDERNAYWGLGGLSDTPERPQQAQKILVGILKNMTDKIVMENVLSDVGHPSTSDSTFPVSTMVRHINDFQGNSELLPEIYQNTGLWTGTLI